MNYIITMSLFGSSMIVFYILLKLVMREHFTARMAYHMLKVTMLFFLIPFPFLKTWYLDFVHLFIPEKEISGISYYWHTENLVSIYNDQMYLNNTYKRQIIITLIWGLVGLIILGIHVGNYLYYRNRLLKKSELQKDVEITLQVNDLKKKYKIKRYIQVYVCHGKEKVFTLGIWKPSIIVIKEQSGRIPESVLQHELVHIKRYDALVNFIVMLVRSMHWFNPLVYYWLKKINDVNEISCDEEVIQNFSSKECAQYAKLILQQAVCESKEKRYVMPLHGKNLDIKERMIHIMNYKKETMVKKTLSIIVIAVSIMVSSLTVFAYKDVRKEKIDYEEKLMDVADTDTAFIPDGIMGGFTMEPYNIKYEQEFIDEEGNIYSIVDGIKTYVQCNHEYVSGTVQKHAKSQDGSCTIKIYNAKRCKKCGEITDMVYINTISFEKCSHS